MDVEVIVETPQGSRNKYKIDPKSGRIRLDRMLVHLDGLPAGLRQDPRHPRRGRRPA